MIKSSQTKMLAKIHFNSRQAFLLKGNFISTTTHMHLYLLGRTLHSECLHLGLYCLYFSDVPIFFQHVTQAISMRQKMLKNFQDLTAEDSCKCAQKPLSINIRPYADFICISRKSVTVSLRRSDWAESTICHAYCFHNSRHCHRSI